MFSVVIVEDEKPILELMKVIVGRSPHCRIIASFSNPQEALEQLPELQPDIAFLDIEMPKLSGLELARKLNECCEGTRIVFTTAYKDYALEAFQVFAFDYLLKPVMPDAIDRITSRLLKEAARADVSVTPSRKVSIRCFGSFEVRGAEGELVRWPTRKTEELFAYLLCWPNQDISKWKLVDMLWPELDEQRAVHNLHNNVYRLKKLLKEQEIGMGVIRTVDGYMLNTMNVTYDLQEFQDNLPVQGELERSETERLEALCAMYSGPLLGHKDYMWKVQLEENCSKQYRAAGGRLAEQYMAGREWDKAEQRLMSCLSLFPLDEELHLLLLRVLAATGKKEQIARHFSLFVEQHRRELGMEVPVEFSRKAGLLMK
ncbi:response regulator [Paenibacillus turpanensis]|uniref:response regulator n=1 Tax=Paenibacillus turpanensis TaxID=2689078 RepID=UPI00140A5CEF|nr:response regulator [Paenibacillus turpanensis]